MNDDCYRERMSGGTFLVDGCYFLRDNFLFNYQAHDEVKNLT
jgi:hypothetical protein